MANLSSLLYIGSSGLRASQSAVRTASDNISNASTPGFRRREHMQSATIGQVAGGLAMGNGVTVDQAERVIDRVLDRRVRGSLSDLGFAEARSGALAHAEAVIGDLSSVPALDAIDEMFNAFEQLAESPQDSGSRLRALEAAESFVSNVNGLKSDVRVLQDELDRQMSGQVDRINALTKEIATINDQVGQFDHTPLDLLDRRDQALTELSELVGIEVLEAEGDRVNVSLRGSGFGLVNGVFNTELSASVDAGAAVISGQPPHVTNPVDLTASINAGQLGGALRARNTDLEAVASDIDAFAADVATAVNAVHSAGFGADGVGGRNLFDIPPTPSSERYAIFVHADVQGQPDNLAAAQDALLVPGDNRNAIALAELRDTALAGGSPPGETLRSTLTQFGTQVASVNASVQAHSAVAGNLQQLQDGLSGVSIDEELTKLMEFRQAYAAAAQIVRTADELMETVVSLKR